MFFIYLENKIHHCLNYLNLLKSIVLIGKLYVFIYFFLNTILKFENGKTNFLMKGGIET